MELEATYRPAVYRYARRRQLQPADAEDIAQQVFLAIAKKLPEWEIDCQQGSFRAWLLTVTRNAVSNRLARQAPDAARGGTSVTRKLAEVSDEDSAADGLEWEFRRAAFRHAAEIVRPEFREASWLAFWRTAVDAQPAERVAAELRLSVGAVYTARSRVLKRLRETVNEIDLDDSGDARR